MALTVTVLFTDLVDSTALLSRVGEETAEGLRREHFSLLRESFGPCGGEEVKNLGDGLMVVFPSAADAVAGAVAAQQAFEHRSRRAEHGLCIRVGIAVGDADVEDGDYFGVPVVQAARLCATAGGDEILISDMVRLLAGSRGGFTFESVGDLELKGLDEPVPACRVCWEPLTAVSSPLPARLASSMAATFVGRRPEHERLHVAWKEASALAERRVVLLSGEPGIGKTTLTARFASEVQAEGSTVVYGRCDEDLGIPYQPWIEALGHLVAHAPQDVLAGHVTEAGAHLARLVPELAARVELTMPVGGDAETERFVLFGCVADLLERVTRDEPALLVLDDLHWADRQSVQLLRHVVTCGRPMRLVVLGTFRDSDVTSDDPISELLAALHREQGVERLGLQGLADDELLAMLEAIAGHEMTDEGLALRDAVLDETAGNPFFVGEILRHLAETGAIYQDDSGRWVGGIDLRAAGLPVSVKEVVGRRLAGLGPDTERVLSFAAVIGRDFDVTLLAAVAGVDEDAVIDICDAAVAAAVLGVTDQPDRYTFAHALIEHTLYDGLSPARRLRAHHAVAEQLEVLGELRPGDHVGQLAYHWSAALRPADTAKAIHYSMLAGSRALEQLAPDEALRWYTQAIELVDHDPAPDAHQRAEILLGLGDAQRQCGVAEHRETLLAAAHLADSVDAVDLLVRAALGNTRMFHSSVGNTDHERIAILDGALARVPDTDSADRARLLGLSAMEHFYDVDLDERIARANEAVSTARRSGDLAALAFVLNVANQTARAPRTLAQRAAWTTEALEVAERLGDIVLRADLHDQCMLVALEQGDLDGVRLHSTAAFDLFERVPQATRRWQAAFHQVWLATLGGDLAEAERLADAALELGLDSGQPDAMAIYAAQISNIRFHQGRIHELIPLIEQQAIETPALVVYRAALGLACARGGDAPLARRLLDEAMASDFVTPEDNAWTTAMACWAEASCLVSHEPAAAVLRDRIEPFHDMVATTHVAVSPVLACNIGKLDHVLGRHDEADAWFGEADALHRRLESPLLVAHSDVAWAALLADRDRGDDQSRAHALASGALEAAAAGGYGYIAADAHRVLGRLA